MLRRDLLHNTALMPFRLIIALALSLALHASLFLPDLIKRQPVAPPRPALQALLRLPPMPDEPADPLLKNTLDPEDSPVKPLIEPPPSPTPAKTQKHAVQREVQIAQRKLNEHLFYPPEAVSRGIEGEVRLIIRLSADGAIDDVSIAASSGHTILDNAAIKAAYAMGKLGGAARELILPVIFQLQ